MVLTIYADMLVAVNLYIDFFLLWCVRKVLGLGARTRRLLLGAFLGAVWALLSLLPLPAWAALPLGVGGALLAALGAFAPGSAKLLGKAALCLWLFSFLLAGFACFSSRSCPGGAGGVGERDLPGPVPPAAVPVHLRGLRPVLAVAPAPARDRGRGRLQAFVVEQGGKTQTLLARGDTGNSLREPFSGLPVIVCRREKLQSLAPRSCFPGRRGSSSPGAGLRLVPFESLGGKGLLPAFRPERVTLGKGGPPGGVLPGPVPCPLCRPGLGRPLQPDLFPLTSRPLLLEVRLCSLPALFPVLLGPNPVPLLPALVGGGRPAATSTAPRPCPRPSPGSRRPRSSRTSAWACPAPGSP